MLTQRDAAKYEIFSRQTIQYLQESEDRTSLWSSVGSDTNGLNDVAVITRVISDTTRSSSRTRTRSNGTRNITIDRVAVIRRTRTSRRARRTTSDKLYQENCSHTQKSTQTCILKAER